LSDSIVAWNGPCILPPALRLTLRVSELASCYSRREGKPLNRPAPFWFAFLSAFSVPRSKHPRPSDARSPSQNPLRASQKVRTPSPRQAGVPFRRFHPVASGVGRDGTPFGQACSASSGQTKRNRAKHHVISYVELRWFCPARFRDAATGARVTAATDVKIGRLLTSGPGRRSIRKSRRGDEQSEIQPTHQRNPMGACPTCCSSERRTCMAWLSVVPWSCP